MICYWYEAPTYLFFAPDLPSLLYYSHIPAMIVALLVGFFVFFNQPKALLNQLLLLICLSFAAWVLINLVAWTNIESDILLFFWSFYGILQGLISILSIYLIYVFVHKKDAPFRMKLIFLLLFLPVTLFAATDLHIAGLNLAWCDAFDYEGVWYKAYYNFLGVVAMVWILAILIPAYRHADYDFKRQILYMGIGIELFLFMFFAIVYIGTFLASIAFVSDSRLEFYGLFGMIIFMVMMGVLIVRFRAFNVGMHAVQALVVALLILIGSQITFATTYTGIVLTTITFVLTGIAGWILIKSVRREIEQRKEIEQLVVTLDKANARLKQLDKMKSEFVSIASHQLRSPLTSIRGYASMLLEGSYGKIPDKAQQALERIADSSKHMVDSVEDYLNVSRIESGNMKYEMSDFNLRDEAEKVVDELRQVAMKKGLLLTFRSDLESQGIVNADIGKTRQALHNLINNSLKYTNKGSITVTVGESKGKKKRIWVAISDTGIGMNQETMDGLFAKFSRAKDANKTNTSGTGLGLFVAKQMIEHMGGTICCNSEGEGKGSTFTLELPLLQ